MHSTPQNPLCVVGLTVYNDAEHIAQAVQSILEQSYENFIFCIVNDGSTDETTSTLKSFQDQRLHHIHWDENKGRPFARNVILDFATRMHHEQKAQYFFWMDGDDIALPQRLEKQVAYMESHPDVDILGSAVTYFGQASGNIKKPHSHAAIKAQSIWGASLFNPTCCFRLSTLTRTALRYDETLLRAQDYAFWIDALFQSSLCMANMSEPLLLYRYAPRASTSLYHAMAVKTLLTYLNLPNDPQSCLLHTLLSCSDFTILQDKSTNISPMKLVHGANAVYEAVLAQEILHMGHFLRITHYKMERFFACPLLEAEERITLLKAYAALPLGRTHDLRPLFSRS